MKNIKNTSDKAKNLHEIVYGPHAIIELIKAKKRRLLTLYTTKVPTKGFERISKYLPRDVKIQYVERIILDRMSAMDDHGGVVAAVTPFKYASKIFDPTKKTHILLLDAIQDVRNLGAILRSAYCSGFEGVVLCKKSGAQLNAATFKTSAGLAEYLDIYCAPSISAAINDIKKAGYNLYMAVPEKGKSILDVFFQKPLCLVIGNEEKGISREVLGNGELITIPQSRTDISYNASVAAGILLFFAKNKV